VVPFDSLIWEERSVLENRPSVRNSALSVLIVAATVAVVPAFGQADFEVVASGLLSPRHLTFAPGGSLYVVEAGSGGTGPCQEHPAPDLGEFCFGFSGGVTEVRDDGPDERVLTDLPSIASNSQQQGPSDIAFKGSKTFVLTIGLGGSNQYRAGFGDDGVLLGTLVTGDLGDDDVSLVADVVANEVAANPDGTDIDSNPVGVLRDGSRYLVADAGGNAVVQAFHGGFSTVAVLPPGSALAPPFLGLPPGTQIPTDAVPTSVVRGPDEAYYISQLTGFPFEQGDASIWRVVPGQPPTVYASGLTNLTDLDFGHDGALYAIEIASEGLLNGPIGALVKITPGASEHETILGGLFAPYGVAVRKDVAYVSICAVCPGGGEVIKIQLD
jgi:hypothetical protein